MTSKKFSLILATADDIHALAVQERSRTVLGLDCLICDTARFPATAHYDVSVGDDRAALRLVQDGDAELALDDVSAIWRRRIKQHELSKSLDQRPDQEISRNDTRSALEGFLYVAATACPTMNDPLRERAGLNKTFQLFKARDAGFAIPDTLMSSRSASVIEFVHAHQARGDQVVYKAFSSPSDRMIATKLFRDDDFERLADLQFAPAIFQRFVAGRNLRVTYVDGVCFPAEVLIETEAAECDWRVEISNRVVDHALDAQTELRLGTLMKSLGLAYGAIDFKLTPDGELVFLEVNPWGQFLFVEVQTGQQISLEIARWLATARLALTHGR